MTVRLPGPVYEKLRRAAFDRRTPMSEIIIEAVEHALADQEAAAPSRTAES
jgi:hypothetical protein